MKTFFINHGEKIFLLAVILATGWSFVMSVQSLGATDVLPGKVVADIEKINNEFRTKKAQPKPVAPYGEQLQANLDGHGIYALDFGKIASPLVYEPPFKGKRPTERVVHGRIELPGGLSAVGDRGKVTFSWAAAEPKNMAVSHYEAFRREEGGEWSAAPVYSGPNLSFEDKPLKPETEYAYKVRAVGAPAPEREGDLVKPLVPPLVKMDGGFWCTGFAGDAGDVKATTPSDVDFECSNVFERFGEKYANIIIKRWSNKDEKWDVFKTEPGIKVGEKVVGSRAKDKWGRERETFDSGYILKEVIDEIRMVKKKKKIFVEDPPNSGRVVEKEVWVDVPTRVQEIVLEKEDGSRKLIVPVGKGEKKIEREAKEGAVAAPPKKSEAPAGGVEELRKIFESSAAVSPEEARKREMAAAAAAAAAGGVADTPVPAAIRSLEEANTTIRVVFPEGWSVSQDWDFGFGAGIRGATDGKASAYKGVAEKSGVIILDKAFPAEQLERLVGMGPAGVPAERYALLLAQGLFKMDREIIGGPTVKGEPGTLTTAAKAVVGSYAYAYTEGDARVAVSKYCAAVTGRVYFLAFVCQEKDYDSLKDSFEKIAGTWTW